MQVALSCEKQHFCSAAGAGHSATGLPRVTVASVATDPHWQNDDAGSERQVNRMQEQRDCATQQTPCSISFWVTDVGLQVVS